MGKLIELFPSTKKEPIKKESESGYFSMSQDYISMQKSMEIMDKINTEYPEVFANLDLKRKRRVNVFIPRQANHLVIKISLILGLEETFKS